MLYWFFMRPFWCRISGHIWFWEEGSRPYCGVCKKLISIEELIQVLAEEKRI